LNSLPAVILKNKRNATNNYNNVGSCGPQQFKQFANHGRLTAFICQTLTVRSS